MWDDAQRRASVRERFKLLLNSHRDDLAPVERRVSEGDLLLRQGAPARQLFLLTAGRVAVELNHTPQAQHRLMVLDAEELLGEMGLFGDGHHSTDVRVVDGPADVIEVDGNGFLRAMLFDADLGSELLGLLSLRCQRSNVLIALLLDGIGAAAIGDRERLNALTEQMTNHSESLARAAAQLQGLA